MHYDTTLTNSDSIVDQMVDDIDRADRRIYLQTMEFATDGVMQKICQALLRAAERGVEATVAYDGISEKSVSLRSQKAIRQFGNELVERSGRIKILGEPSVLPSVRGRSHGKLYLADDISWYGGGVNLSDDSFHHYDAMFRTDDPAVAATLEKAAEYAARLGAHTDYVDAIDAERTLLVDGGNTSRSRIVDEAIAMVHSATNVWYVSQLSPAPELANAMIDNRDPNTITANLIHGQVHIRLAKKASHSSITARVRSQIRTTGRGVSMPRFWLPNSPTASSKRCRARIILAVGVFGLAPKKTRCALRTSKIVEHFWTTYNAYNESRPGAIHRARLSDIL